MLKEAGEKQSAFHVGMNTLKQHLENCLEKNKQIFICKFCGLVFLEVFMMHINYCLKTENVEGILGRRQFSFSLAFDNLFPEEFVWFIFSLQLPFAGSREN